MHLIDTHAHLTYPDFQDIAAVIAKAKEVGVLEYIVPALDPASAQVAQQLAEHHAEIYFAVGTHPLSTEADTTYATDLISHPKCVAVGEIGTDINAGPTEDQSVRLRFFLDLAVQHNKPAIIHIRDTWDETFKILAEYPQLKGRAVIHCFTGLTEHAQKIKELGLLISITAISARKTAHQETLDAIRDWPLEQMMLETDCPYLPWPGEKYPNTPTTVAKIAQFVADLKGIALEEVAQKTTATAQQFFSI